MNPKAPLIVVVLLLAGYIAYPYLAMHSLIGAIESGDAAQIEPKVDWPAVRQGFKDDLNGAIVGNSVDKPKSGLALLGMALGSKLVGGAVDALVTPEGLAGIIREGRRDKAAAAALGGSGGMPTPPPTNSNGERRHTHVVWAFFDGPASFTAQVRGGGESETDPPVRLRFELEGGGWILTRVFLPLPS